MRNPILLIDDIAMIAHEANRAYCLSIGDTSQPAWEHAPEWAIASARNGVQAILDGRVTRPEESHESWLLQKQREGWTLGPVKDPAKKEHPCMVPYDQLPQTQQLKDHLFFNVVMALTYSVAVSDGVSAVAPTIPASTPQDEDGLINAINAVREGIKTAAKFCADLRQNIQRGHFPARENEQPSEVIANVVLSYRHLEDAGMRLGKAIQMRDGGISVYDKKTTVGA